MTKDQLRAWRKSRDLTQKEAAAELEVSLPQYQKWEQGQAPVRRLAVKYINLMRDMDSLKNRIALSLEH